CETVQICAPSAGESWVQDSIASVVWNPLMTAPFGRYDFVDVYIVDDLNATSSFLLKSEVDLNLGVMAAKLDANLFPENLPANRSCHIVMTKDGDPLDGNHPTLNSSSFFMFRTKQTVSGTLVPIVPTSTVTTTTSTLVTSTISTSTHSTASSIKATDTSVQNTSPTSHLPEHPAKSSTLSPLVIGLISAGCVALLIALVAIFLLLRARRQSKGDTDDFMSLHDQLSPTGGSMDQQGEPTTAAEPVLTAGDAQLIAETFRKSMRKPRWEDQDDEDEQDEARRAAKELLRKELNEEGVDVRRGVQRRVTVRDRPHRSSVAPPLSQIVSIPEP
ncbi:hypothetical protein BG011_000701, partial [Mortierella polycephala]